MAQQTTYIENFNPELQVSYSAMAICEFNSLGMHLDNKTFNLRYDFKNVSQPSTFAVDVVKGDVGSPTPYTRFTANVGASSSFSVYDYQVTFQTSSQLFALPSLVRTISKSTKTIFELSQSWIDGAMGQSGLVQANKINSVSFLIWSRADSSLESSNAYDVGYDNGYKDGKEVGRAEAETSATLGDAGNGAFNLLKQTMDGFTSVLSYNIIPNVSLGTFVAIPLIIGLIATIFRMVKK